MSRLTERWQAEQGVRLAVAARRNAVAELGETVLRIAPPVGGWPPEVVAVIEKCRATEVECKAARAVLDRRANAGG